MLRSFSLVYSTVFILNLITTSLTLSTAAYAQSSVLITSGMGGGASSTARLSAIQAQQMSRIDDMETCGNKGQLFGPGFGGATDGDNCLTNMSVNPGGGLSVSNDLAVEGNTIITNGGLSIGTTEAPASRLDVAGGVKIANDTAACTNAKNGTVRYVSGASPPWQFCNGGAWVNFKQPQCQDNDTAGCYLEENRSINDPDFIAANIRDGVKILGVTGTYKENCTLPWGGTLINGQSTSAYLSNSPACGESCQSQTRTCTDGNLSGSYTHQSCSVAACSSCARPWGGTVPHGSSILAYQYASVGCGSSCNSQIRSCNDGVLSGSYTNSSCSVGSCCAPDTGLSCCPYGSCASNGTVQCNGSCDGAVECSSIAGNACLVFVGTSCGMSASCPSPQVISWGPIVGGCSPEDDVTLAWGCSRPGIRQCDNSCQ